MLGMRNIPEKDFEETRWSKRLSLLQRYRRPQSVGAGQGFTHLSCVVRTRRTGVRCVWTETHNILTQTQRVVFSDFEDRWCWPVTSCKERKDFHWHVGEVLSVASDTTDAGVFLQSSDNTGIGKLRDIGGHREVLGFFCLGYPNTVMRLCDCLWTFWRVFRDIPEKGIK